ncbi:MAG: NUDIX hydrolase [Anaerolineales bacterium]|nr:NUDIX hydrolase [Anaerolineales bacterium]
MSINVPIKKKEITNGATISFNWRFGENNSNVILENSKLNVKLLRYIVTSADGEFLYDAFSIRESKNNTVVLIRNQENEIGLVWEWRPIPEKWFWACPRGFADPNDEDNLATAKREMIEEIGNCKVINSKKIGNLYSNTTFFENPVGLALLDVEEAETHVVQEEEGITDFKFYSKEEILKMIREDKVEDTFTLSALMRYFALEGF